MFIGILLSFACSCPTCCRTWAWCCRSLRKILTWEKSERNKEVIITTNPRILAKSQENKEYIKLFTVETSKKEITRLYCTFSATITSRFHTLQYVPVSSISCFSHVFLYCLFWPLPLTFLPSDLLLLTLWPSNPRFSNTCQRLTVVVHRNKREFFECIKRFM